MDLQLDGRRAFVTASTGGIGAAIAKHLAAEGAEVLVHGRDAARAAAVADEVSAAEVVLGDLTDDVQAEHVIARARAWNPQILVNNAGPFAENDWDSATPDDWRRTFDANVVSVVRMTQALLPGLRAHGWGRVITIGTRAATTPLPNMADYSAAKAAVVNLTTSLSRHLAGTGITAVTVSPGVIVTDGMRAMFEQRAAEQGRSVPWSELEREVTAEYAPNPTGRLGRPDDIAAAVAFVCSPLADYVNGIDLRVDGGLTGLP